MCGIVGLFLKEAGLQPELGALTRTMLGALCDRGPDSAGFAVYGAEIPGHVKLTLRAGKDFDWDLLLRPLADISGAPPRATIRDTHAVIAVPVDKLAPFYSGVQSYQDLPPILCDQIAHFFQHYKDLERGKWVNIVRWVGPDEAAELIAAAIARAPG